MTDGLRKVKSGDLLAIPAGTFNAFIDAAEDFQRRRHDQGSAAKAIVQRPVAAYVEKVYDEGDFSGLGIGT